MKAYKITERKNFMGRLLGSSVFDSFLLAEASITTYNTCPPMNFPVGRTCAAYALT